MVFTQCKKILTTDVYDLELKISFLMDVGTIKNFRVKLLIIPDKIFNCLGEDTLIMSREISLLKKGPLPKITKTFKTSN